jgi:nucleotide-binding universal stress UspA family protein
LRILLATDGSEYSEEAAKLLTCLNLNSEDEITVFHAVSWIPFLYDEESYYTTLKDIKREIAPKVLDAALETLKRVPAKISAAIIDGSPEEYIVNIAEESGMDMIVMGARGIKGIKTLFVGSVTRVVASRSTKPVLIVRAPIGERKCGMKILFATDGSDYSLSTARFLSSLPFAEDTEVTILNVIWSKFSDIPERFSLEVNEKMKDVVADARRLEFAQSEKIIEKSGDYLTKRFKHIAVLSRVGDPSEEILKTAESFDADMIAVGCRGLKGIKGMMGSVSKNILNHAKCSVLIGKTSADERI